MSLSEQCGTVELETGVKYDVGYKRYTCTRHSGVECICTDRSKVHCEL